LVEADAEALLPGGVAGICASEPFCDIEGPPVDRVGRNKPSLIYRSIASYFVSLYIPMEHPESGPPVRRGDINVSPGRHRMTRRRCNRGRQLGRDLLYQRAKLGLHTRVLIEQIRKPARPALRLSLPDLLQFTARFNGELLVCMRQPLLRDLGLPSITTAHQPGEPTPDRLPRISDRRTRHRLPSKLRQSY